MDNEKTETKVKKKGKKVLWIVLGSILTAAALAALIIFLIIPSIRYSQAKTAIENGNYIEAYNTLVELDGFRDSQKLIDSIYNKYLVQYLQGAEVGDTFKFGTYEQDNNTGNGGEDIEWIILDKQDGKVLALSKYALDCVAYNSEFASSSWETCTIRPWLNETFMNAAFQADDQNLILTTTVTADTNPLFDTNPGNDTQDKIFLLSISEAEKYGTDRTLLQCAPTKYAIKRRIELYEDTGNCRWWLRSPGLNPSDASAVGGYGYIYNQGNYVFFRFYGARPAMWIDITQK